MWKEVENRSWQEVYERILGKDGEGEGWMREVELERGKRGKEEKRRMNGEYMNEIKM